MPKRIADFVVHTKCLLKCLNEMLIFVLLKMLDEMCVLIFYALKMFDEMLKPISRFNW